MNVYNIKSFSKYFQRCISRNSISISREVLFHISEGGLRSFNVQFDSPFLPNLIQRREAFLSIVADQGFVPMYHRSASCILFTGGEGQKDESDWYGCCNLFSVWTVNFIIPKQKMNVCRIWISYMEYKQNHCTLGSPEQNHCCMGSPCLMDLFVSPASSFISFTISLWIGLSHMMSWVCVQSSNHPQNRTISGTWLINWIP